MVLHKPEARSGSEPTVEFVYTLRGYALLWVVLDHAVVFTEASFGYDVGPANRSLYHVFDDMTEGTRLPILMFLAALFVDRGFNADARSFITKRIRFLVWPVAALDLRYNPGVGYGYQARKRAIADAIRPIAFDVVEAAVPDVVPL